MKDKKGHFMLQRKVIKCTPQARTLNRFRNSTYDIW